MKREGTFILVILINVIRPDMVQCLINGEVLDGIGYYHQQVQEFQSFMLDAVQSVLDGYRAGHILQIQERLLPEMFALAATTAGRVAMVPKK